MLFTARYFLIREIDPDYEFGLACGERYLKRANSNYWNQVLKDGNPAHGLAQIRVAPELRSCKKRTRKEDPVHGRSFQNLLVRSINSKFCKQDNEDPADTLTI
jgi:hypothetical protein